MVWPAVAIVNKKTFEGMPEEDQKIIKEAIAAAAEYAALTRAGQEEEFRQTLKDEGMDIYEIDPSLFDPYKKEFDEKYGKKDPLIQEFIDTFRD
jgi:TRAP-type C4-dicarboxylate transport system substrate-binding protein